MACVCAGRHAHARVSARASSLPSIHRHAQHLAIVVHRVRVLRAIHTDAGTVLELRLGLPRHVLV
jgi:hypothetical protein